MAATAARFNALVGEADRLTTLRALSPEAIQGALLSTARLSSSGISEGAASYAVLSASAHAPFASSLQTAVNLLGRDAVLERLKNDPEAFSIVWLCLGMMSGWGIRDRMAIRSRMRDTSSEKR
jgi:hypothetical protein